MWLGCEAVARRRSKLGGVTVVSLFAAKSDDPAAKPFVRRPGIIC
jgi:hypothetical protein